MTNTDAWAFFQKWATKQGLNHNTWLSWRKRGVPHWARLEITEYAKARRFRFDPAEFTSPPAKGDGK